MKNEHQNKRLLVMAGGTGGHIFPALAVAKELQQKGWEIRWLGTADRMEATLVPEQGIEIDFIEIKGIVGSGLMRKLLSPWMIFKASLQAKSFIKAYQPNAVLGMGGYVSGPGGVAAFLSNVPIVLHEQNAVAGLTNRLLSKIAKKVLQAFPTAFKDAEVVGNPVRQDICDLAAHKKYQDGEALNILITGGSQGAQILNTTVPKALSLLNRAVNVRHQAGKGHQESTSKLYQEVGVNAEVTEFINDVASAYAWADVVICRSGALSVCEIAVAGVSAIFVPFQHKDRQQALNGDYLVNHGASMMIEQSDLTPEILAKQLEALNEEKLNTMAQKAKELAIIDAAARVASAVEDVAI